MYELEMYGEATGRDLHIERTLSNLSVQIKPKDYIVDQVAPIVPVQKQSNLYRIWSKEDGLRLADTFRAPKTPVKRIFWGVSSKSYFCKNYALGTDIALEDAANADEGVNLAQNAIEGIVDGLWRDWENRVATFMTNTANVGSSTTISTQWTDQTASDPIGDIFTGINAVFSTTGFEPNRMVIGRKAFQDLQRHPQILAKLFPHGSGAEFANADQIAQLFDLEKILVGKAIKNTADENITGSFSQIWGNHVILYYSPPTAGLLTPAYMYSFRWQPSNFPAPMAVRRGIQNRVGESNIEIFEAMYFQTEQVIASELAYLMLDAV